MSLVPVYQYKAFQQDGSRYFYSTRDDIKHGWKMVGIIFYAYTHPQQYGWCWANECSQISTYCVYQHHYDQSKTYGGKRFLYSFKQDQKQEGWTFDQIVFHVFNCAKIQLYEKGNWVQVHRYHAVQKDGWRFRFATEEDKPSSGWIKDDSDRYSFWARKDDK